MLPAQYTYLFGASLFVIPWLFIYCYRKDLRSLVIKFGMVGIILGTTAEYLWWTKDWWQPQTITGTILGIEDIILAFLSVGVGCGIYLTIFSKKLISTRNAPPHNLLLAVIIATNFTIFLGLFSLGINSFIATISTFTLAIAMMVACRKDLILPSLINGIVMVILVIPIFQAMFAVTPGYVANTWLTANLIGVYLLGIPLEDLVFYFIGGAVCFCAIPFYTKATVVAR